MYIYNYLIFLFFPRCFLRWAILKSLLNLLQYCFCCFYSGVLPIGMWDLPRPGIELVSLVFITRRILNLWTTREAHVKVLAGLRDTAAAAAKSLQSCPTLFDPIDGSPSGSPVPRIPKARTLGWVAISFSNA